MKRVTIKLSDGDYNIDVEDGFDVITDGKVLEGDKTYYPCFRVFEEVDEDDIGEDVGDFFCVIRKTNEKLPIV